MGSSPYSKRNQSESEKCGADKGNIVQWHQGFEFLKKSKKMYFIPSVCEAPGSIPVFVQDKLKTYLWGCREFGR